MTSPLSRICSFSVHPTDFGLANFHSHVSQFLKINLCLSLSDSRASLVAQRLKHLPPMQETWVRTLGWEDPLEKEMVTTPVFLPGESHGVRGLVGYSPQGHKESDTTERLHFLSCGMQDLSSPTRDRTHTPCNRSARSFNR